MNLLVHDGFGFELTLHVFEPLRVLRYALNWELFDLVNCLITCCGNFVHGDGVRFEGVPHGLRLFGLHCSVELCDESYSSSYCSFFFGYHIFECLHK